MPKLNPIDTLQTRLNEAEDLARRLRAAIRDQRIAAIVRQMDDFQISVEDLRSERMIARTRPRGFESPKRRANVSKGKAAPVKYVGPENQPWSGRGRTPLWLTKEEAAGRHRDEFLAPVTSVFGQAVDGQGRSSAAVQAAASVGAELFDSQ